MRKAFKLIRDEYGDFIIKNDIYTYLCSDVLHEYFEFPEKTKVIEVVLSNKSGAYPIRKDIFGVYITTKTRQEYVALTSGVRELIRPLFIKHSQLYVTLFY